jgi:aminotransferase
MSGSKSRRNYVAPYVRDTPRSGIREFFEIVSSRKDVISLSIGEPDFVTPWHIREAAIFALDHGATSYTANLGTPDLRQAVSDYVRKSYGVKYSPESEILITVGVSEAFDLAIRAVVEPGFDVMYHEPCYVSYPSVIAFSHGRPVCVETKRENDFRLTREMLEKKITNKTRVLILNFPTNPTGAIMPRKDMQEIAKLAVKHDLVVIADDIYAELTYDEKPASIARMPGMRERTILLNGFSKSWAMTGFRVGFACSPPELTEAMMKIHQYTMLCAPILSQKAGVEAIRNGMPDIADMRNEYRERRNFIHAALNEMGLPCHMPRGAFYAFPYIGDYGLTSKEFSFRLLNEEKVACVPGSAFGASGEGYLRCSYATDIEEIKEAMKRIGAFVQRLRKR